MVPVFMKRLSSRHYVSWLDWLLVAVGLWLCCRAYQQSLHPELIPKTRPAFTITIYLPIWWVVYWIRRLAVYDDGDAIVVRKWGKQYRIPYSNIGKVVYERYSQRQYVVLHFVQPCELGAKFRFLVGVDVFAPRYHPVADEIHLKSGCCKGAHGDATAAELPA